MSFWGTYLASALGFGSVVAVLLTWDWASTRLYWWRHARELEKRYKKGKR